MPLEAHQIDEEERKEAGRQAAIAAGATEKKPHGNTSATVHPYTYWYVVGWNEVVEDPVRFNPPPVSETMPPVEFPVDEGESA